MGCSINFPPLPVTCEGCDNKPYIGENGYWDVGDTDTGIKAQGPAGPKGESGQQGIQGPAGVQGPKGDTGKSGVFTGMDLIFSGDVSTEGSTYTLKKPVTDYKELIVELEGYQTEYKGWLKGYHTIAYPIVSSLKLQYGYLHHADLYVQPVVPFDAIFGVYYHFPTAATMCLDGIGKLSYIVNQRISKIYGMK